MPKSQWLDTVLQLKLGPLEVMSARSVQVLLIRLVDHYRRKQDLCLFLLVAVAPGQEEHYKH